MQCFGVMDTMNEIGFDGSPRFVRETHRCTYFDMGTEKSCGALFEVVIDRHSLNDGSRTCGCCRHLPTVTIAVWGCTDSGRSACVFPSTTLNRASRERTLEIARKWSADWLAAGGSVTWHVTRHTHAAGSRSRRIRVASLPSVKFANLAGYSDVYAHEVVRIVSTKTIEVRRLKAKLLNGSGSGEPDALNFSPGGFHGHTSGAQRYSYESDESEKVFRIRRGKRGWRSASGGLFKLSAEPREYYDFNF